MSSKALADATAAPAPASAFQPIPPFSDVIAGNLPAVSLPPIVGRKTDPLQEYLISNYDDMANSGLEMHETPDAFTVLFNPKLITAAAIDKADKEGRLQEVAPFAQDLLQQGGAAPAQQAAPPAAPAPAPAPALTASPAAPVAGTNKRLQGVRLDNLAKLQTKSRAPNSPVDQISRRPI